MYGKFPFFWHRDLVLPGDDLFFNFFDSVNSVNSVNPVNPFNPFNFFNSVSSKDCHYFDQWFDVYRSLRQ